jgi:hypothetical protein
MATAEFFYSPDNLLQEGGGDVIYFHTRNRRDESLAERLVGGQYRYNPQGHYRAHRWR